MNKSELRLILEEGEGYKIRNKVRNKGQQVAENDWYYRYAKEGRSILCR